MGANRPWGGQLELRILADPLLHRPGQQASVGVPLALPRAALVALALGVAAGADRALAEHPACLCLAERLELAEDRPVVLVDDRAPPSDRARRAPEAAGDLMCTHMYVYVHVHVCASMHACMHARTYACTYACMYVAPRLVVQHLCELAASVPASGALDLVAARTKEVRPLWSAQRW